MHYVFDTSRRLLLDDRGIAVKKLYIKRYDKIDWDIDVVGGGTSVGFTAGRFDGTGVIPLIKTSSPVSGGKATLTPQSNTSGLRDMLIIDGVMQPSVEFPGEFIVSDADGKRVASINIPVEFAAAIDSPDADVEELGRAVITASMTTLPAGSQGTVQVEPTGNGYNFKFALPQGAKGEDGANGTDISNHQGLVNIKSPAGNNIMRWDNANRRLYIGDTAIDVNVSGNYLTLQGQRYATLASAPAGYVTIGGAQNNITVGASDCTITIESTEDVSESGGITIRSTRDIAIESTGTGAITLTGSALLNGSDLSNGGSVDLSNYVKKTDYASGSQYGLVKIGSNMSVSNGVLSIPYASASSYGVMRAGSGLSASNGIISAQGGSGGGGVASINGLTDAVTLHLGLTTDPDNPDIKAIYIYASDKYGNQGTGGHTYIVGMQGATLGYGATNCLKVGGEIDGDNLNIKTSDGKNILSYNGSGAITIGNTSMTVNIESEQLSLSGASGVSVKADGTSRISIGAGGSERIDIGGSHHVISIVSTGRVGSNDALYLQGGNQSISMTFLTPAMKIFGDVTVNNQPIQ